MGKSADWVGAARTRHALLAAVGATLFLPAPAHADGYVDVYEWGVSPEAITVNAGEGVHFTNWSGLPTAIVADTGLFDSGALGPGAGFSVAMTVPGTHVYRLASAPTVDLRIVVLLGGLAGPPDELANDHIPQIAPGPAPSGDLGVHPEFGAVVSRSRILVGFTPEATVAEANGALEEAGVRILGATPTVDTLIVEVPSLDQDAFETLDDTLSELRDRAAVEFASMSFELETQTIPAAADTPTREFPGNPWLWDVNSENAAGGNWGLERSRFPQAWNLREAIENRGNRIVTGIIDAGYDSHADLPRMSLAPVCFESVVFAPVCSATGVHLHGTHVAGIIGADHDGASPTEPRRTRGVAGANPVAEIRGVNWNFYPSGGWDEIFMIYDLLLDEAAAGLPLRAINFSVGLPYATEKAAEPNDHLVWAADWWRAHPDPVCGPGNDDDGTETAILFCTPNNDDDWLAEVDNWGQSATRIARRASSLGVLIAQAAGNDGATFCVPAGGQADFLTTLINTRTGACHTASSTVEPLRGDVGSPFAAASRAWLGPLANPTVVVENLHPSLSGALSSNIGGDVSAPGTEILSTFPANGYNSISGTSMAAPFVAGLITYLLAFDPTLTVGQVREKLETWAVNDVTLTAPRIDAYATLMSLPEAHKAMVDVNDPSKDGNRRIVLERGNVEGALDNVLSSTSGHFTDPDGHVDMRDFRRFRDAYILTSTDGATLNGPPSHKKRDLNFDGCTFYDSPAGSDADSCLATENTFSRFDFNGNGDIGRFVEASVPTESGPVPMTDLRVMERQWDDDRTRTEGWEADDLADLFPESGDVEIHADALFDSGAGSVELTFRNPDTGVEFPPRTLARSDEFLVATVPAGTLEITAAAATSSETVAAEATIELAAGEDERVDLCAKDLVLSASRTRVPAGGGATAAIFATFDDCEGGALSGKEVTFSIQPITADGATVLPEIATTDADGHAETRFRAGAATAVYTVSASLDLGDGQTLDDEIQIEVVPALKISYVWRQENLEWSESGSSRWGLPADPLMPDCTTAVGVYCIDSFTLGPEAPMNPLEREGVIEGFGRSLTLTEEVAPAANSSRQSWTLTNPDGSTRSDQQVVGWKVATNQLNRYTNYQLPTTMLAREDQDAIRLFGLKAVGELGYVHDAAVVTPGAQPTPIELWFTTGRLLLQPRGDGSALQYAPNTTWPIEFPRRPDATFAPYSYCQTIDYDLTSQKGYWNPSSSEWISGAVDQGRKPTYTPGDRPMPVGPGHLRVRYSFAAVAQYGSEDPVAVLPDCSQTHPPDAEFDFAPIDVDEGRMVSFRSTSTDPDNDIVAWEWNFGDGTIVGGAPNRFGLQPHLFEDNGVYEVSLKVTDSEGHSDTTSKTILVANLPPEATIEDVTGVEGHPVDVPFSVWDPGSEDKQGLEVEITTPSSPTPLLSTTREAGFSTFQVNGLSAGTHTLTLRVEDKDGAVATDDATVTVLAAGETPPPPPPPGGDTPTCVPDVALDAQEQLFLGLLNDYRAQSGLAPVGVSPTLTRAAERHATDMAEHDFLSHTGSDGSTPFERAQDAGYPGETVSENAFFGSSRAQDALVGWKSSQTGHNENMLQPQWAAIGIARAFGTQWYWSTSFGDVLDCPGAADGGEGAAAATAAAEETASKASRTLAALTEDEPAAAVLLPYDPLAAFTISNLSPRQNQLVAIANRSRDAAGTPIAATLEYRDGEVVELGPDESTQVRFEAFNQAVELTATDAGGRTSSIRREIWVEQLREPTIQYLGDTFGAVGKPLAVSAKLLSPWDNTPVPGLQVTFALGSASAVATTGADGIAQTTLVLTGATAGDAVMTVTTTGTDDFAAGSSSVFLFVVENHPPVANPGGPYVTGDGATLLLDGGLSTDPDPGDGGLLTYAWDLDGDGAFDDAEGATPAELQWEEIRLTICGGLCATGTPYPIALQVTDRWGDSHSASTTVTVTADFGLVLGAGAITIVPGASNSVAVHVVGSAGWTEPVTLSVTGLPTGVTATFSKNPVTPTDTSVLTLTAGASVETGSFPLRVIGTGGGLTRETGEEVTVAFGLIPICFGTYSGTVVDSATGAPVPDVQIRLLNLGGSAMTDENGRYVFRNVPLGTNNAPRTHFVRTVHNGYWEKQVPAEAVCRGVTRLDFEIVAKLTGRLSGTVIDRETRLPLTGARLTALDGPTALTDADGRYALDAPLHPNNQPRFYTYKAEATGYWPQDLSVTVDPAAPQERNYELLRKCQGTIRGGTVRVQQTNALVANAVVRLTLSSFQFVQVTTNAQGEFTFNRLVDLGHENTPVQYSVQAFPPAGSPSGSASGFSTFSLESCGAEASTEIFIRIPVENLGALEGVVRDEETLEPLAGATVRACGATCVETSSGADGTYRFTSLHIGYDSQLTRSFTVQGSKGGYYTFFAPSSTVTANATTQVDLVLLRQRFGRLEGTVTDVVSGAPIPEAAVQDFFGCAFNSICAITNREGRYADPQVPLGTRNAPFFRSFQFTATGYWPVTRGATFTADTTTVVDVQLLKECPAARVVGTVVNAETQAPINGALVAGGGQSVLTDPSGRFTLTGLRAGAGNSPVGVSITASASGFISQTKNITIFCGATIVVDFGSRESALGIIVGTVTNADTGAPIEDVLVASEFGATESTDANGSFRFEQVPLGDLNTDRAWKVTAFPTGFKPQTKTVIARANVEVRADFAFTVLGNTSPVANALAAALDEDRDVLVDLTGSDADSDPLTFHVMRYPAHGRLLGTAPNLRYLPDRDFSGGDTFEFVVNDGLVNSERATVTLDVAPVNDAPAGFQDLFDTGVDVPLRIAHADLVANDTDVDGDELVVMNVFPGSTFQVEPGDGFVLVTPPPGFESSTHVFAFNYQVGDGNGGTSSASAYVRVTRQPIAPVCADASFETDVGAPLDASVSCTDGNGDALTYELVSGPAHGLLGFNANGTFTFTPAPDLVGTTSFVFRATDGTLTSTNATATIEVVRENGPPVAADAAATTDEDTPVEVDLPATDPDGDTLSFTHGDPQHGSFDGTTYTPEPDFHGTDSFAFTADDGFATDEGTITITVRPVNDAPVVGDRTVETDEDTPLAIALGGSDVDGDALAITSSQPGHGSFSGGVYTPDANYHGPDSFEYTAADGHGGADTATVSITVRPVNDPPVAGDQSLGTDEDTPLAITFGATDLDGGELTFAAATAPQHGSWDGVTYTPASNYHGPDSFDFIASDGRGGMDGGTISITVRPVNDAPDVADRGVETDEDTPLAITLSGPDADGDALTITTAAPAHGTYAGGVYTPASNYHGPDSFTYTASDGHGGTDTATVSITVRPVNDAPNVDDVAVTTPQDTPLAIALAGTDVDGDALTITHTAPAHGGFDGVTYTPAAGYSGPDSFTYTASDGHGGTDTAPVAITVTPTAPPADTSPPTCLIVGQGKTAAGNAFIRFQVNDVGLGIARHELGYTLNTTVTVDPYTPGALGPIFVQATAINKRKSMAVEVFFYDLAGQRTLCDPIVISVLREDEKLQDETFHDVAQADNRVTIYNGDPGMRRVVLLVNGTKFKERDLKANEVRKFNIAAAMKPGYTNTITVRVRGKKGASALIVIADIP